MGVALSASQLVSLLRFQSELLTWNRKINLTAITEPMEVIEKHLIDSLAASPCLRNAKEVLDLGAGGGLPSFPLAILYPGIRFTLVDTVAKKVGFLKAAAAVLKLTNLRAIHARAGGKPAEEGLPRADLVLCRAFMEPRSFLGLAQAYLEPGGHALLMLGGPTELPAPVPAPFSLLEKKVFKLPFSGANRAIVVLTRG